MSRATDLAWAAGLFDGEGNFGANSPRARCLTAAITQNEREVLDRFCKIVGVGRVYGPYQYGRNPFFIWRVVSRQAERVAKLLWPFLSGPKRGQLDRIREEV